MWGEANNLYIMILSETAEFVRAMRVMSVKNQEARLSGGVPAGCLRLEVILQPECAELVVRPPIRRDRDAIPSMNRVSLRQSH